MATALPVPNNDLRVSIGSTPWGQLSALLYVLETNDTGRVVGANGADAPKAGDTILLGVVPYGFRLIDSEVIVTAPLAGTAKVGFRYVNGVDDPKNPQADDYFGAAVPLSTKARVRNAESNSSLCPQTDAFLAVTVSAAFTGKGRVEFVLYGIAEGTNA